MNKEGEYNRDAVNGLVQGQPLDYIKEGHPNETNKKILLALPSYRRTRPVNTGDFETQGWGV